MARSAGSRPLRTLGVLLGLTLLLYGVIAAGVTWSNAQWTPKLALDLEGGTEMVLAPVPTAGETGTITQNTIDEAVKIIRQRVNGNGVSEAEITTQGRNIVVSLPGKPDPQTKKLVEQSAQLRFRAVIEAVGVQREPEPTGTATSTPSATGTAASTAKPTAGSTAGSTAKASIAPSDGAKPTGTAAPSVSASSNGAPVPKQLLQATPTAAPTPAAGTAAPKPAATKPAGAAAPAPKPTDASDPAWAEQPVAAGSKETYGSQFLALDCVTKSTGGVVDDPAKPFAACSKEGDAKYLLGPAEVLGSQISEASATPEANDQGQVIGTGWQVNLSFDGEGAKKFGDVTTRLAALQGARNQFAIVLDGLAISAPQTRQAITGGRAQITGTFTEADAMTLANQLKFGALPISFQKLTDQDISATLGSQQLKRGLLAGLIGLVLVVLYSLLQYRALGLVTVASLIVAGGLTYGLVVLLGWRQGYRLSLAGVAGLIVSIGITADSFIVFFERVRDEVRDGRSLLPAVEAAWVRARRTILASDGVSFLAAVVLFILALGGVRGFAFTLGLTTVIDILVVFMFTKPMVTLLSKTRFFGGGHKLSGFDAEHLGRSIAYTGRGRVRTSAKTSSGTASGTARTGSTIAERRAAMLKPAPTEEDAGPGGDEVPEAAVSDGELATSSKTGGASSTGRPNLGKES